MPAVAKLRYLRIAPRKVRLVADLIRGKSVNEAETILNFTPKKAALPLLKLLKQAIANAKNLGLEKEKLFISKILVDEGPKLKRVMPRARGQANIIQKKTSHITLLLDYQKENLKTEKKHGSQSSSKGI
jgi:large subunit ribosomal protein L22